MTDDLVVFLRARLMEDWNTAHGTLWGGSSNQLEWSTPFTATLDTGGDTIHVNDATIARHIARHDPAHVLRDIAAKRRIMARHTPDENHADVDSVLYGTPPRLPCRGCGANKFGDWVSPTTDDCPELRDLATAYEQHPDYKDEWRP